MPHGWGDNSHVAQSGLTSCQEFSYKVDLAGKCSLTQAVFFLDFLILFFLMDLVATHERRRRQIFLLITLCSVEWPLVKWLEYLKEVDTNINISTLLESRKGSEPH